MENMVSTAALKEFYAGKSVLVTGHTGFKGSWLSAVLHGLGARTIGYALAPESIEGIFTYTGKEATDVSIIDDVRNAAKLKEVVSTHMPDLIFHLAAQPLVRVSYEQPAETFDINVTGTANLLDAVRNINKKCSVIVITTDKVYFNREEDVLYTEEDRLGGYDPYSASKACAEFVVDSFRKSFFNPNDFGTHRKAVATVRAGNVIGGGDWSKDRLLPDIVHSLRSKNPILVRNPLSIRPWQHVLEAISGYLILGLKLDVNPKLFSTAFNLGPVPEDHLSVKELVETAISIWGSGDWTDVSDPSSPHEAGLLKLSVQKALRELEWLPRLRAGDAIRWTLEWYQAEDDKKREKTALQINEYFGL